MKQSLQNVELLVSANNRLIQREEAGRVVADFCQYVEPGFIAHEMDLLELELKNRRVLYGARDSILPSRSRSKESLDPDQRHIAPNTAVDMAKRANTAEKSKDAEGLPIDPNIVRGYGQEEARR